MKSMNIYLITHGGESYWICAFTAIEALLFFTEDESITLNDFDVEDNITMLDRSEWSKRTIKYKEPEKFEVSFEEYMNTASTPEIFASSTYE